MLLLPRSGVPDATRLCQELWCQELLPSSIAGGSVSHQFAHLMHFNKERALARARHAVASAVVRPAPASARSPSHLPILPAGANRNLDALGTSPPQSCLLLPLEVLPAGKSTRAFCRGAMRLIQRYLSRARMAMHATSVWAGAPTSGANARGWKISPQDT